MNWPELRKSCIDQNEPSKRINDPSHSIRIHHQPYLIWAPLAQSYTDTKMQSEPTARLLL